MLQSKSAYKYFFFSQGENICVFLLLLHAIAWWSSFSDFKVMIFLSRSSSEKDRNLYLVSDKRQATQDNELSAMNLVPDRRGPGANWAGGGAGHAHWSNTQQRVWGFINNLKRDPYTTTISTLSKFYDAVCKLETLFLPQKR